MAGGAKFSNRDSLRMGLICCGGLIVNFTTAIADKMAITIGAPQHPPHGIARFAIVFPQHGLNG
jgi:hypothetical protein